MGAWQLANPNKQNDFHSLFALLKRQNLIVLDYVNLIYGGQLHLFSNETQTLND